MTVRLKNGDIVRLRRGAGRDSMASWNRYNKDGSRTSLNRTGAKAVVTEPKWGWSSHVKVRVIGCSYGQVIRRDEVEFVRRPRKV